jgi:hypothetical protein
MPSIFSTAERVATRDRLFAAAMETLGREGWKVERLEPPKLSVRRISKGEQSHMVAFRTTQDQRIAFARMQDDSGWTDLGEVNFVVATSVDSRMTPQAALVHMIPVEAVVRCLDLGYAAWKAADHPITPGRDVWIGLYEAEEEPGLPAVLGAGIGLTYPPLARVQLPSGASKEARPEDDPATAPPLTIAEAKRQLAMSLGVREADIAITIRI